MEFKVRCSSLGCIMPKSSGLTPTEAEKLRVYIEKGSKSKDREKLEKKRDYKPKFDLSKGAKTFVENQYKEHLFIGSDNFVPNLDTKATLKGNECEDDSIELYNEVFFRNYKKLDATEGRITKDGITGCCDIDDKGDDLIIDIKSSYTYESFPMQPSDINSSLYEWQLRGYMMLYNRQHARLAYCLVETPDHLIPDWEDARKHDVSNVEPRLRVTVVDFERDMELEKEIMYKIAECQRYYKWYGQQLDLKNI